MAKYKTKLQLISNEPKRRVIFKKRKETLFRKLNELATLCGVIACALVYDCSANKMYVWPSPEEANLVLQKFQTLPAKRQGQFMMDQEDFMNKRIFRLQRRIERQRMKNQALEEKLILNEYLIGNNLHGSSPENLREFGCLLGKKMNFIKNRIEFLENLDRGQVDIETGFNHY